MKKVDFYPEHIHVLDHEISEENRNKCEIEFFLKTLVRQL